MKHQTLFSKLSYVYPSNCFSRPLVFFFFLALHRSLLKTDKSPSVNENDINDLLSNSSLRSMFCFIFIFVQFLPISNADASGNAGKKGIASQLTIGVVAAQTGQFLLTLNEILLGSFLWKHALIERRQLLPRNLNFKYQV